ncbi:MAG: ATP-binding protein [Henriciella sp.]|nr:ATP-binding protein [Henriciella sp.]
MRTLVDLAGLAPFALLQLDERRRIVGANPEAQSLLGHSERAMLRSPLSEIVFHDSPIFGLIDRAIQLDGDVSAHSVSLMGPGFSRRRVLNIKLRPTGGGGVVMAFMPSADEGVVDSPASVAAFGRILGHEVKNPLAGISGAAQLLARKASPDQTGMLDIIQNETKRIERLISRLSAFELFSSPRITAFNIHELLDQVIAAEELAHGNRLKINRLYDPSLPLIEGDQDHLHEAVQNVLRNAAEAAFEGPNGAAVSIETAFETGFAIAGLTPSGKLGRAIRITIRDNGGGIPPEKREKMFDLFTSSKSGGRGLGLNVVSEIVSAHRGRVKIDSQPGDTRFSIYLPIKRKTQS